MRVAIFHDYFSFIGGGEKLILTLARHLGADVITTEANPELISRMGFDDVRVISLGPLVKIKPLKQIQATYKFATCDFRGKYDFFIFSGNWAHHASRLHKPNLFYCHTPVRVFYDQRENFLSSLGPAQRAAASAWIALHSRSDRRSVARIQHIVCNSRNAAGRVKKYYGRDADVIYPPVDTGRFAYKGDEGFWLSVNRLYPEKRIELQVRAFEQMPGERLVIVGNSGTGDHSAAYAEKLRASLPHNVRILSDLPEEELIDLYGRCRGLIATPLDEDFGMNAVEAMASGKPVVAVREGGYLESVVDGVTGMLIDADSSSIVKAVKDVSRDPSKFREACAEQARKFDISVFLARMEAMIP
ncbi:putative glycosyltransferase [Methanocella paludicola SANAE]|uniref:GDP-Man:Man(1)GlcNAc(2)-PP-Dol alpha-1,3-mannosyltransferase n=1 Tax=Methanocella paludicola (strain DSM 17711 / JCM 13418 / NBRC 101707 / SANAE) TaxID=304371 RepID=D1YV48_METPS|nr:glycosyltransferase [Methanocella paludicola]BAI60320.1 putative glycosyltransferase [Methanocella paludicola SANAE]